MASTAAGSSTTGTNRPGPGCDMSSNPSTEVSSTSNDAPASTATRAERASLSPKRSSSMATLSFSLMMGTTLPISSSLSKVRRICWRRSSESRSL